MCRGIGLSVSPDIRAHPSEDELRLLFDKFDVDGSGKIDEEEFVKFQRMQDDTKKERRRNDEVRLDGIAPVPEVHTVSIDA